MHECKFRLQAHNSDEIWLVLDTGSEENKLGEKGHLLEVVSCA